MQRFSLKLELGNSWPSYFATKLDLVCQKKSRNPILIKSVPVGVIPVLFECNLSWANRRID